jgi:ABC-type sugar transport system ATPase subunit
MTFFNVRNLSYKYEDQMVLEKVSFECNEGELIAIVGPSGCGKTTLLKTIVGILSPKNGSVFIKEIDITKIPIEKRAIGYVPQNQALFPHLTIYDNIAFGLQAQNENKNLIHNKVIELASMSGLEDMLNRKPHELSGGQQQRVALLRALAPSPQLLLLDEPLSNIDAQLREQLAIYIRNLQMKSKITTLFVTHDLDEAKMLADKLVIINKGRVIQTGSTIDVIMNPLSIEVATTLSLKNLYKINQITNNGEQGRIKLLTDIGEIELVNHESFDIKNGIKGLYINPSMIKTSHEPFKGDNSFKGNVIAVIPEPMLLQAAILVKILIEKNEKNNNRLKMLRILISISSCDYKPAEDIFIQIPQKAIQIFK